MSNVASPAQIRLWLLHAKKNGATHVFIVRDGFDYSDYPVEVHPSESAQEKYDMYSNKDMQRVMEVYALHLDIEGQLNEDRAMHLESPPRLEEVVGAAEPAKPTHTMTSRDAWEYETVSTSGEEGPILSRLGADGWELVAVLNCRTETRLYFKRRKRA